MMVHAFWFEGGPAARVIAKPSEVVLSLHMSRVAVFLFFITSGYVIGLTNQQAFSWSRAREYLRRRCLRLVPIYLVAIGAGWLANRNVSGWLLLGNVLFLQNPAWHIQPLPGDVPVWSLHNEAVYYLGFLVLWALRPRVVPLAIVLFGLAAFDWFVGGPLSFLGGWSVGALFWLSGLLLSWRRRESRAAGDVPIISLLLVAYATTQLWPGVVLLKGLGFPYAGASTIWLADLALLPVAISIFCAVTRLDFPLRRPVFWIAVIIPVATCILLQLMGRLWASIPWTMAGVATIVALPLLTFRQGHWGSVFFRVFRPLGKISYALYLLHVPCVALVSVFYTWTGGWLNYAGGFLCWLALTLAVAWFCETRFQPFVVSLYKSRA